MNQQEQDEQAAKDDVRFAQLRLAEIRAARTAGRQEHDAPGANDMKNNTQEASALADGAAARAGFLGGIYVEDRNKIVDALCAMAVEGFSPNDLEAAARALSSAVMAISASPCAQSDASRTAP